MHNEILRAFNDSCELATRQCHRSGQFAPAADAYFDETTNELVARVALPGLSLEEIELFAERRELVVRGERQFPSGHGRIYQQVELDYGPFERRLRTTVDVDPEGTTASYEAGILEVRMKLAERETGARRIDIRTSGGEV